MTLYAVSGDSEPTTFFATQREALAAARDRSSKDDALTVIVERCQTVPLTKDVIVRLVNGSGGFVDTSATVATFLAGRRVNRSPVNANNDKDNQK